MFSNQLLIAMPNLTENLIFDRALIYLCEHSEAGAIGIMVNHPTEFKLKMIFEQLEIANPSETMSAQPVYLGGPVQQERGFVLHKPCEGFKASMEIDDNISISTSKESLTKMAKGAGPSQSLVALGYAGWGASQLDNEIKQNVWLTCSPSDELIFELPVELKWEKALESLGIDPKHLSSHSGHA